MNVQKVLIMLMVVAGLAAAAYPLVSLDSSGPTGYSVEQDYYYDDNYYDDEYYGDSGCCAPAALMGLVLLGAFFSTRN